MSSPMNRWRSFFRDPNAKEQGASIEESFAGQAPDVRIALDLSANGGFLLTFRSE